MFYSEAILTKKGPLAKVWLAAHWEKKLSKAQFLQTDISQSVDAIVEQGQGPLALRLTGQLLLGVVRIYSRKTRYLLDDCSDALIKIKMTFRPANVDMAAAAKGSARVTKHAQAQITLPDALTDFDMMNPEFALNTESGAISGLLGSIEAETDSGTEMDLGDISIEVGRGSSGRNGETDMAIQPVDEEGMGDLGIDLGDGEDADVSIEAGRRAPAGGALPEFDVETASAGKAIGGEDDDGIHMDSGADDPFPEAPTFGEDDFDVPDMPDDGHRENSVNIDIELPGSPIEDPASVQDAGSQVRNTRAPARRRHRQLAIFDSVTELPGRQLNDRASNTADITRAHKLLSRNPRILELQVDLARVGAREDVDALRAELVNILSVDGLRALLKENNPLKRAGAEDDTIADNQRDVSPPKRFATAEVDEQPYDEPMVLHDQSFDFEGAMPMMEQDEPTFMEHDEHVVMADIDRLMPLEDTDSDTIRAAVAKAPASQPVHFAAIARNKSRTDKAALFYETLLLATRDMVAVQQDSAYGDIRILAKPALEAF